MARCAVGTFPTAAVAPGGARAAANPDDKFLAGEFDLVRVVDPAGGQDNQVRTIDTSLKTLPHRGGNRTRILLTIYEGLGRNSGPGIVDVAPPRSWRRSHAQVTGRGVRVTAR
ncbi:hypothetical protein [Streptosporangium sp. NPDC002607]